MYIKYKSLCDTLNQYKRIIIYGTGYYAQEIYPRLIEWHLKDKIVCFAQSEECQDALVDGIPVHSIRELDYYDDKDCIVLVAVGEQYAEEIKNILLDQGYHNILFCIDYMEDRDFNVLNTFEEYCESIADWYAETHMDNLDRQIVLQKLLERGEYVDTPRDTNLIVIIFGELSVRLLKMLGALKRKKYNIVMLDYCNFRVKWLMREFQKEDVPVYKCNCIEEMLYNALKYYPLIYLFQPRWGDCMWPQIMIKYKMHFGKTIIALYDVLNDGYVRCTESRKATEKYVLEHADGIVWRWFSKEYLEEKGFKYQGKSIQFLDYCNPMNEKHIDIVENKSDISIVKLCMVNSNDTCIENKEYDTKYMDFARIGEILEVIGNREDCILHFYVGSLQEKNIVQRKFYEAKYQNFEVFVNTEHEELMRRLKDYDYGCDLFTNDILPPNDMPIGGYYGSERQNSVRNIYFDYISSGLPIISTSAVKFRKYIEKYDIVIEMDLTNIDIDFLRENKQFYKERVRIAREELVIDNHIMRLIDFFKEV